MADPSASGAKPPARPRWVKVLMIVAIAVVVLFVAVALVAGGEHGPSRHVPGDDNGEGHTPPVQHTP